MHEKIAIIDLGGQYAHMIGRRLRDFGAGFDIFPKFSDEIHPENYKGFILSGGPNSVTNLDTDIIPSWIYSGSTPVLGICFGHQLLAKMSGFSVAESAPEFGPAAVEVDTTSKLFQGVPAKLTVWMSHNDSVENVSNGFQPVASSKRCKVAAYQNEEETKFGIQFHPEVNHSEFGTQILENFVKGVCGLRSALTIEDQVDYQIDRIREESAGRSIFFFVSGGVDSMVAFMLCAKAVGHDKVRAVYVDTGFMRAGETDELVSTFRELGLGDRLSVLDESGRFFDSLKGVRDPEEKRNIIGRVFVEVQSENLGELERNNWMLGQGTIYPDTIESGGDGGVAAKIKTHHNRCAEIVEMVQEGRVIEPIKEFYKDEVRLIGRELGLREAIVGRWPFPGPGLAIRCLCSDRDDTVNEKVEVELLPKDVMAFRFPVRSVGVQGDARTYLDAVALFGKLSYDQLSELAIEICNNFADFNRVVYHLAGTLPTNGFRQKECSLTRERVSLLQEADAIVKGLMSSDSDYQSVWQFPVVMLPISSDGFSDSIVLRPVNSQDGMTANFARLNWDLLRKIANKVASVPGIDSVYLDVSDKPPATIEWE